MAEALVGSWKLESFKQHTLSTGEVSDRMGAKPAGYICFSADGRMQVIITEADRKTPSDLSHLSEAEELALYRSMMAYAGTWHCDENGKGWFDIDVAWNQTWCGEHQGRNFAITGDTLAITVGPQNGVDGVMIKAVLTWSRVAPEARTPGG
ncbi:MAG: lipocalin-like domain-containing protein [Proteobacteria bacterium]|nr:lipocalin-like domain-containing protein [Pseudomonadota bacterium]